MKRVALSWSSGKDSAWSLHLLRQDPSIEVAALITTFNQAFDRVAMHAVRSELVEQQAESAGLPLWKVPLPWPCSNEEYEARMSAVCERALREGVQAIAFGDLFLADIRAYRERQLAGTGLEPVFPVWQIPTRELAVSMIGAGLRARVTCIDPKKLPREFAGREFDAAFLAGSPTRRGSLRGKRRVPFLCLRRTDVSRAYSGGNRRDRGTRRFFLRRPERNFFAGAFLTEPRPQGSECRIARDARVVVVALPRGRGSERSPK